MLATLYTAVSLPCAGMDSRLHSDPQEVLAKNLEALFQKRGIHAREVGRAIKWPDGSTMSNKTVSNMLNAEGAPQLDKLIAVSKHLQVPLWQLFCPGIDPSHFGEDTVHALVELFCSLSELGRRRFLQNLEDAVIAEQAKRGPPTATPTITVS